MLFLALSCIVIIQCWLCAAVRTGLPTFFRIPYMIPVYMVMVPATNIPTISFTFLICSENDYRYLYHSRKKRPNQHIFKSGYYSLPINLMPAGFDPLKPQVHVKKWHPLFVIRDAASFIQVAEPL